VVIVPPSSVNVSTYIRQIQNQLNPSHLGISVTAPRTTRKGNIVIGCSDEDCKSKLENLLKEKQIEVAPPLKRKFKFMITGVPSEIQDKAEILSSLKQQNPLLVNAAGGIEKFDEEVIVAGKKTCINPARTNWYILSPHTVYQAAVNSGRIGIGWYSCVIQDANLPTRCFKCNGFGHSRIRCRVDNVTCPRCSGDHELKDCDDNATLKCSNCCAAGQPNSQHSATSKECPIYLQEVTRYKHRLFNGY
jgi:hypothetical protein